MDPILIHIPMPITTDRLLLRPPQNGDEVAINKAIVDSFEQLKQWMPWAENLPSIEETATFSKTAQANWILRKELVIYIFDKVTNEFIGATGYHNIIWKIPSLEIGYWINSKFAGQGYITEATNALTIYAFKQLKANRVEIRCDDDNIASKRVAEKLGFTKDGLLKNADIKLRTNKLRNTVIFGRVDIDDLDQSNIKW